MPGTSPIQIAGDEAALRVSLADVTTLLGERGTVFKTRVNPPRNPLLRHHAACQPGAVFTALDAVIGTTSGREHDSTPAGSVVAGDRDVVSATVARMTL